MKNRQRFAEIEFCLDHYFKANLAPVMRRLQNDLNSRQAEEYGRYKSSLAGILSDMADASHVAPGLDTAATYVRLTGEWSSKTTEDYMAMCRKDIAGNKTIRKDLEELSAQWRKAVVTEIGRARYDQLSARLGSDLAYAYVDYRVQQQMLQHMVDRETPRSTAEYIMKKAATGSLIGLGDAMQRSPLAQEITDRAEKAYNPSMAEKATARGLSFGVDVLTTGSVGSWASVGRFAATEIVFDGIELAADRLSPGEKTMTVEECISQAVFSSGKNLFPELRKQGKGIKPWESDYIKGVNSQLGKKMGIATEEPLLIGMMEQRQNQYTQFSQKIAYNDLGGKTTRQEDLRKKYNIPSVVAPGKEEEYIKSLEAAKAAEQAKPKPQEQQAARDADVLEETATSEQSDPQSQTAAAVVQNPQQDNSSGWGKILGAFGLDGFGDIGPNLGYIISMLPDILVGMWTGKTKSLDLKDNLVPYASVLAGMFVKNPILKMLLIGMGGANLLNKASHEVLAKEDGESRQTARPQYLRYADQPLNPRITDVTLSCSTLIATIDKVPCTVRLTEDVVNACQTGALPLNTLANTILERSEQRQAVMDNNYERLQEQQRQQQVILK